MKPAPPGHPSSAEKRRRLRPPTVEGESGAARRGGHPRRLPWVPAALGIALSVALAAGILWSAPALRERWLEHQTLTALGRRASDGDALTRLVYGRRLLRLGRDAEALAAFQQAEAALPAHADGAVAESVEANEGCLLARNGRDREAVPLLKRALALDGDDPVVYLGMGQVLERQGNGDAAEAQYRLVVGLAPDSAEGWFRLGRNADEGRKPEQAVGPLRHAAALEPGNASFHAELGNAFAYQRQFPAALAEFRQAQAQNPTDPDYRRFVGAALAECARTPAEYTQSRGLLERSLRDDPQNATLEYDLGRLCLRFQALTQAQAHLARCVQLSPAFTDGWYCLAQTEKRLGHRDLARQTEARFHAVMDLRNDEQVLEKRTQVAPRDSGLRLMLARNYAAQGNLVGADQQYGYALLLQPGQAQAARERQALAGRMRRLTTQRGVPPAQLGALGPALADDRRNP